MVRTTDFDANDVVLFDMDGVIVEGPGMDPVVRRRSLDALLTDRGLAAPDDVRATLGRGTFDEAFVQACGTIGVDPHTLFEELERRTARRAVERIDAGGRDLYPDVDVIDDLAEHTQVGLVSNHYDSGVQRIVDRFDLDAFSVARGRATGLEGYERRKPDPYYLLETLDELDARGGIYVGDRESDLRAADRAGLSGVFIRRDHNADVTLSVDPTMEIQSLAELRSRIIPA